jgi:hypothetical protein
MSSAVEWNFKKGHFFAALAGSYTFALMLIIWGYFEGQFADRPIYVWIATILGTVIWGLIFVLIFGLVLAPWSYILFRVVSRFKKPNLAAFIAAGICSVPLTVGSIELLARTMAQFQTENQEDYSIFVDLESSNFEIIFMISLVVSASVGGAAFYYLGKKHPTIRSTVTDQKENRIGER